MALPGKKYNGLRKVLNEQKSWPCVYMFKFIMPADNKVMAQVESMFYENAKIYRKESKKGKYLSVTIKDTMNKPEDVIYIYKKAEEIPGVMIL